MRHRLEYAPVWLLARVLGALPRPLARAAAIFLVHLFSWLHPRLRRIGLRNLQIAFPEKTQAERRRILRRMFTHLGRQLAEFCLFPRYTRENVSQVAMYEHFEIFDAAVRRGKGVLFLTGHFGAWELSSFVHSLNGYPVHFVIRPLDNPYLDRFVDRYRTLHGATSFGKRDYARGILTAMKRGETVGILVDQNALPTRGIFVDFFGVPACTVPGPARVALHTGAAVVPAFCIWDDALRRYRTHFGAEVPLIRTGNDEADVAANTAAFTKVIESYIRKYPDQWLWVHRRWKTRPEGEASLY